MTTKQVQLSELSEFRNGKFLSNKECLSDGKYDVFGSNGIIAKSEKFLYEKPVIVIGRVGANCGTVNSTTKPSWITDNCIVSIPNSNIWNSVILNHSHNHTRRIDIEIGVDYNANMDVVSKTLLDLAKDNRVLSLPKKPEFLVVKYDDSAIIVRLRLYSNTNNWYALYSDLMKKLKPALDKAGIEIPYPQRVIHTKSH